MSNNVGPIDFIETRCCALAQLSMENSVSQDYLGKYLEAMGKDAKRAWHPKIWGGQRTAFVVTVIPGEERLEEKLKGVGFTYAFEFPRRNGYPRPGKCHFWYKVVLPEGEGNLDNRAGGDI